MWKMLGIDTFKSHPGICIYMSHVFQRIYIIFLFKFTTEEHNSSQTQDTKNVMGV